MRYIRDGVADVVIAGAAEAPLRPLTFGAFAMIKSMSTYDGPDAGRALAAAFRRIARASSWERAPRLSYWRITITPPAPRRDKFTRKCWATRSTTTRIT